MSDVCVKSMKLISWQKPASKIYESLLPNQRFIIKSSRQKGKSTFVSQLLLHAAINKPKSKSYYFAPTMSQSRLFFQNLSDMISSSALVTKINESLLEVTFWNRSKIYFRSCEQREHLRGGTATGLMVLDEMCFYSEDIFPIILPYTNVHKTPIIAISTPRRKSGTYYDWWVKAISGDEHYRYLDVNDYDCSFFISDEQIEEYRATLTPERFKNEILGLFSENNEGLFGDYQSLYTEPEDKEPVYCGIDFSSTGEDYTVMSFFNKNKEQCMIWSDRDIKDPVQRCEKMATILNSYPTLQKVICEKNSIGSVYIGILKRLLNSPSILEEFTTTNDSKKEIIENLVTLISKKEITLLKDSLQDYQLGIFITIPLSKGNYSYQADTKCSNSHDDFVMSLAIACKAFTSSSGVYTFGSTTKHNKYEKQRKYS